MLSNNGLNPDAFRCTSATYGKHPQIVECRVCGHVYTNPRWSDDELIQVYSEVQDDIYTEEREGRELTFKRHLADIEEKIGPANGRTLLDVGAYIGVFVEEAIKVGWSAQGIEPSNWAVELAERQQLPVQLGTLENVELFDYRFNVITMWDVIEHLADPRREVTLARELLVEGGYIIIHTMDISSRTARLMGRRWPWLMDMHLHYFSRQSLGRMLEEAGYEIVWSGAQGRHLRIGYLASRLRGMSTSLGSAATKFSELSGISSRAISVDFGDLFTVYARKPLTD